MQAGASSDDNDEEEDGNSEDSANDIIDDGPLPSDSDSSEEPDMILAEITTTSPTPNHQSQSQSPIPEALVHKLLTHHFEHPQKTKLSSDARAVVARYLEVFVREAVMRSAFEREGREGGDGDGDGGVGGVGGFLEVRDLERCAVQLCLDF